MLIYEGSSISTQPPTGIKSFGLRLKVKVVLVKVTVLKLETEVSLIKPTVAVKELDTLI